MWIPLSLFCFMNRVYVFPVASPSFSAPLSPLWDLDAGIDRPWSELESEFLGDLK